MENKEKKIFEKIYEKPGAIWTRVEPPGELIKLIESGKIKSCKVLDVGCGEGIHSVYLAKKGFDVVGIDLSENAISHAKENAKNAGVEIRFIVMDVLDLESLSEKFDFVLEWAVMHHLEFGKRKEYVECINNILNKEGTYLSVCFNRDSKIFGEVGESIRNSGKSAPGLEIYFSTKEELDDLFTSLFDVIDSKVIRRIEGTGPHAWNYLFMEKKDG